MGSAEQEARRGMPRRRAVEWRELGRRAGGKAARELAEEAEEPRGELGEPQEALEELRGGAVAPHPLVRRRANNVGARSAVTLNARFGDYRWGISRGVVPTRLLEFVA